MAEALKAVVLGGGMFGTAIANILAENEQLFQDFAAIGSGQISAGVTPVHKSFPHRGVSLLSLVKDYFTLNEIDGLVSRKRRMKRIIYWEILHLAVE